MKTFYLATDSRLLDAVGQDGSYMYVRDHEAIVQRKDEEIDGKDEVMAELVLALRDNAAIILKIAEDNCKACTPDKLMEYREGILRLVFEHDALLDKHRG